MFDTTCFTPPPCCPWRSTSFSPSSRYLHDNPCQKNKHQTQRQRTGKEKKKKRRRPHAWTGEKKYTATIFGYEKESKQKSNPNPSFESTPKPEIMRNMNESTVQTYNNMSIEKWMRRKVGHPKGSVMTSDESRRYWRSEAVFHFAFVGSQKNN